MIYKEQYVRNNPNKKPNYFYHSNDDIVTYRLEGYLTSIQYTEDTIYITVKGKQRISNILLSQAVMIKDNDDCPTLLSEDTRLKMNIGNNSLLEFLINNPKCLVTFYLKCDQHSMLPQYEVYSIVYNVEDNE